jgi:hypothetical protein
VTNGQSARSISFGTVEFVAALGFERRLEFHSRGGPAQGGRTRPDNDPSSLPPSSIANGKPTATGVSDIYTLPILSAKYLSDTGIIYASKFPSGPQGLATAEKIQGPLQPRS